MLNFIRTKHLDLLEWLQFDVNSACQFYYIIYTSLRTKYIYMFALSFYVRNRIHCLVHALRIIIIFQIFNTILTNLHCLPFSRLKNKNRVALKDSLNYAVTERDAVGLNLLQGVISFFPMSRASQNYFFSVLQCS